MASPQYVRGKFTRSVTVGMCIQAATLRTLGCNPMHSNYNPMYLQAVIVSCTGNAHSSLAVDLKSSGADLVCSCPTRYRLQPRRWRLQPLATEAPALCMGDGGCGSA